MPEEHEFVPDCDCHECAKKQRDIAIWMLAQCCKYGSRWMPARSINHKVESWKSRIANAWGVLVGKYDALDWEETK